jgi:hypothetical protein
MTRLWVTENQRNVDNDELFTAMIQEAHDNTQLVVTGHHIIYKQHDKPPQEIPSADWLIFDHETAHKVWGDKWRWILTALALEPAATRDALLHKLYYGRGK